jgi:GNAT superfamily N-acetyltransferase
MAGMTGRERAIAWRHATQALVCDELRPWEHGTAIFARSVPGFWTYNSVRVEGPDAGLEVHDLAEAAERFQSALRHRHVEVEDEATGARVRPGFVRRGWIAERHLWMELEGAAHGARSPVELTEVPFAATRPLRAAWFSTSEYTTGEAETQRFMSLEEEVAERRGTRALAAWGAGGEMVGFVSFSAAGAAAEVEQVYVDPPRRDAGVGAALVAAAVDVAGAASTFIVADDEGDPKRRYARLGFAGVWTQHLFSRRLG